MLLKLWETNGSIRLRGTGRIELVRCMAARRKKVGDIMLSSYIVGCFTDHRPFLLPYLVSLFLSTAHSPALASFNYPTF
jgi:hypothetical protein